MERAASTVQAVARRCLRVVLSRVHVRGRHRLVDRIGSSLGSDLDLLEVGPLRIEIRHALSNSRMMYYGIYEPHLTRWIAGNIRAGDQVIEPGVNVGFVSGHLLEAVGPGGLVVGLEPSRRCVGALRENNRACLPSQFRLFNAALAAEDGDALFFESEQIHSHGYGCLEEAGQPENAVRYSIPTRCVDSLMDEFGIGQLRFLKLDVEGSELPALRGASRTLAARRIDHILVETELDGADDRRREVNREIRDLLTSAGFTPHCMSPTGRLTRFDLDAAIASGQRLRTDLMWTLPR